MLLKKKRLELKYTLLWLLCGCVMLLLGLFPNTLTKVSQLLGVYSPTNALFAIVSVSLIFLCLSLTIIVSKQKTEIKRLAQSMAILDKRLRERL